VDAVDPRSGLPDFCIFLLDAPGGSEASGDTRCTSDIEAFLTSQICDKEERGSVELAKGIRYD